MTVLAKPDNDQPRANGSDSFWAGMTSGWEIPPMWRMIVRFADGTSESLTTSGGFGPTHPKNDKVNSITIAVPNAAVDPTKHLILKSCYATCDGDPMEKTESIDISVRPARG
ncbi:hypothetical protein GCM10023170_077540 [Phytohabitans houttuyneae]|uniref:Uncharacterized protein n=1 Tax=Phytohabitans houttuyneae TaxID=1076126 RepID=A0A6V8KRM8_9ACTN|nr:hypothetical protein Phou_091090 [Phytohabitans houttuyneae]